MTVISEFPKDPEIQKFFYGERYGIRYLYEIVTKDGETQEVPRGLIDPTRLGLKSDSTFFREPPVFESEKEIYEATSKEFKEYIKWLEKQPKTDPPGNFEKLLNLLNNAEALIVMPHVYERGPTAFIEFQPPKGIYF